jgi:hypothetical protein
MNRKKRNRVMSADIYTLDEDDGRGDNTNKIEIYIPKIISSDDETEERTEETIKVKIVVVE